MKRRSKAKGLNQPAHIQKMIDNTSMAMFPQRNSEEEWDEDRKLVYGVLLSTGIPLEEMAKLYASSSLKVSPFEARSIDARSS